MAARVAWPVAATFFDLPLQSERLQANQRAFAFQWWGSLGTSAPPLKVFFTFSPTSDLLLVVSLQESGFNYFSFFFLCLPLQRRHLKPILTPRTGVPGQIVI